ncbi:MAG: hypothetical protein ACO3FE_08645, partial [Planctomycetaceae bacterium]
MSDLPIAFQKNNNPPVGCRPWRSSHDLPADRFLREMPSLSHRNNPNRSILKAGFVPYCANPVRALI